MVDILIKLCVYFGSNVFDSGALKLRAADLNSILDVIRKEEKDVFVFYPNQAYLEVRPSSLLKD